MRSFISDFSRARSAREKSKTCNHTQYRKEIQVGDNNQPTKDRQQRSDKRNTPTNHQKKHANKPTNETQQPIRNFISIFSRARSARRAQNFLKNSQCWDRKFLPKNSKIFQKIFRGPSGILSKLQGILGICLETDLDPQKFFW